MHIHTHTQVVLFIRYKVFTFLGRQKNRPNDMFSVCSILQFDSWAKTHIIEFSRVFGFPNFDLCCKSLLSKMTSHTTCLIYSVQLIAGEDVDSQGQVFLAHSAQDCNKGTERGQEGATGIGSVCWRM